MHSDASSDDVMVASEGSDTGAPHRRHGKDRLPVWDAAKHHHRSWEWQFMGYGDLFTGVRQTALRSLALRASPRTLRAAGGGPNCCARALDAKESNFDTSIIISPRSTHPRHTQEDPSTGPAAPAGHMARGDKTLLTQMVLSPTRLGLKTMHFG